MSGVGNCVIARATYYETSSSEEDRSATWVKRKISQEKKIERDRKKAGKKARKPTVYKGVETQSFLA
ncbi:unnamed protein product [Microthlaspi erraticum]|uniref:Uncharacterized protein n=1 Tax=Microthlaspi erraticum TaxID=1685480 RepID=A0A6D2K2A5_9BRAS|nr:unnamed protein product [Microthlaspi erraticum]